MKVIRIDDENAKAVASLMTKIKPIWWQDYNDAYGQLINIEESIGTVGWFIGDDADHPKGWALFRELKCYKAIELECCGYDDNGIFKLEHKLKELFDTASEYAKSKGYTSFRTGMSTVNFNIDGKDINDIPEAIKNLQTDRIDYKWLLEYGFRVIGLQPNAYGERCHLILLAKAL